MTFLANPFELLPTQGYHYFLHLNTTFHLFTWLMPTIPVGFHLNITPLKRPSSTFLIKLDHLIAPCVFLQSPYDHLQLHIYLWSFCSILTSLSYSVRNTIMNSLTSSSLLKVYLLNAAFPDLLYRISILHSQRHNFALASHLPHNTTYRPLIFYTICLLILIFVFLPTLQCKLYKDFLSLLFIDVFQCLAHDKNSINICWMNEGLCLFCATLYSKQIHFYGTKVQLI